MPLDIGTLESPLTRSPSGLFTARVWERSDENPDASQRGDRDRRFALWVHAEAKSLAAHLERLAHGSGGLSRNIRALTETLWADAEWARRHADGSGQVTP